LLDLRSTSLGSLLTTHLRTPGVPKLAHSLQVELSSFAPATRARANWCRAALAVLAVIRALLGRSHCSHVSYFQVSDWSLHLTQLTQFEQILLSVISSYSHLLTLALAFESSLQATSQFSTLRRQSLDLACVANSFQVQSKVRLAIITTLIYQQTSQFNSCLLLYWEDSSNWVHIW